ncbi:glycosyltransferase family 2 protein [Rodentibacter haemolyticus]|uniref:Glycosyltransferase family 2 protein n=1 Tax=Rodentibacter haemolyticus TaxID=2778911 RepID=A0ABX6UZK4_9PAST|nr:glycosyltransferase family 2 protein [Rodentibacter haemolyticus]QPB43509.1 glycosyltransferase family 2 protein [Rodentibacter haemolyticus]
MNNFNPVAIIPHYNHSDIIGRVIEQLQAFDLAVLVVDDGSSEEHKKALTTLENDQVSIVYSRHNGGKGAAVKIGLAEAFKCGFTHAIQVDADGQHNLADIATFLEKSHENPTALICGKPIYGEDAPKARLYGRKITNFWIAVNTLSTQIEDGMCGFRLYPLVAVVPIVTQEKLGDRMDFDIEILVRCQWRKIPMIWVETPVKYDEGGVSHFRGLADNWLISKMHARLFFTMLMRLLTGKWS